MIFIVLAFVVFIAVNVPEFRELLKHPFLTLWYCVRDSYRYIHDRKWRIFEGGFIDGYCAYFGGGKTISMVDKALAVFKYYNNQRVYDRHCNKWVLQRVHIISNVMINGIPSAQFEKLENLGQIVNFAKHNVKIDEQMGTRTCCLVVIDEAGSELNSRAFKSNISPEFLGKLVTVRHLKMGIVWSAQEWNLADKLLRDVTKRVIWCSKTWRYLVQRTYSAREMEACGDPTLLKPLGTKSFFVKDSLYDAYDTLASVDTLEKQWKEGDFLTEQEILELRGQINTDVRMVNPSRKFRKRLKTS